MNGFHILGNVIAAFFRQQAVVEGDIYVALLAVDFEQIPAGSTGIAVQRREVAVIAQGDFALPQGCEGPVFAVGRGVGVLQVAAVVGGIDPPLLHANTGGNACRLILTVVGVVEITVAQAAGVERQVVEVVAVFIDSGNERAGDIGVTRDFDLGLAARGERGELELGIPEVCVGLAVRKPPLNVCPYLILRTQ
ncbi:hypothetical protein IFO68_12140 [Photobacterium sp. CAU 1568]|uniref:Uncharacterized protein n=1 Tax=Photobacterium arenosum TaxID=2774143 RepID=A0ABR9BLI8_9GAMM|nr:hypothetical protein [Photobacterium arenosum]MBD8513420.1 hypothetical protein [Photobacterium arenosum]